MQLSKETVLLLEKAGWFPERCVDIIEYVNALTMEGYMVHKAAQTFLRSFGGLTVYHPHAKVVGYEDTFHINPIKAANDVHRERIETYFDRVGEKLVVIGQAYREYMILSMSESGKVFASQDDLLFKLGDSGYEAIETLCHGKTPTKME